MTWLEMTTAQRIGTIFTCIMMMVGAVVAGFGLVRLDRGGAVFLASGLAMAVIFGLMLAWGRKA